MLAIIDYILLRLNETPERRKQRMNATVEATRNRRQRGKQPNTPKQRTFTRAQKSDAETKIELEELIQKQEHLLIQESHIQDEPTKPSEKQANRDLDQDCQDAFDFRCSIDKRIPNHVCAVCNTYRPLTSFRDENIHRIDCCKVKPGMPLNMWTPIKDIPNLKLLQCDVERTEYHPRPGLTRLCFEGMDYCLQPYSCTDIEEVVPLAQICNECHRSLAKKHIPDWSLVRFDPGEIPRADNVEEQLLPLTMLEANLLASNRVVRYCYVIRPWGDPDQVQKKQKGHVIAFPNNPVNELANLFPVPLNKIPELVQCIFIYTASEKDKAKRMKIARQSKALHVRGRQIIL